MERFEDFMKKFPTWPATLQSRAIELFSQRTMEAMGTSKRFAPKRKGFLIRSARRIAAKITPAGVRSAYQFIVPYAAEMESGMRKGKPLNISQRVNPEAQSGFGQKGIDEATPAILGDLKTLVGLTFGDL
jgi:hypothetical protein